MSRKLKYEDYEPDEFEKAYKEDLYDYEHPECPVCGNRMVPVRRSIGTYGYYTDCWECEVCN